MRGALIFAFLVLAPVSTLGAEGQLPTTAREPEPLRLKRYGLEALAPLATAGREIRRATYSDMYNSPTLPSVTLEKSASNGVTLTVYSDGIIDTAVLKPEAWTLVTASDAKGLAPSRAKAAPAEICHGAGAVIEAAKAGKALRRNAEVCSGAPDVEAMEYARSLAQVAVTSIPRCAGFIESGREYSWSLRECLRVTHPDSMRGNRGFTPATANNREAFTSYAISTKTNAPPMQQARSVTDYTATSGN